MDYYAEFHPSTKKEILPEETAKEKECTKVKELNESFSRADAHTNEITWLVEAIIQPEIIGNYVLANRKQKKRGRRINMEAVA